MLFLRKITNYTAPILSSSSPLFFLLFCGHYKATHVSNYHSINQSAHNSLENSFANCLNTYPFCKFPDVSFSHRPYHLCSSSASTILVQAKDPSRIGAELVDAVNEQRLDDAWKLYELYFRMDGFPRRSILNKLINGLSESQDHQWLDKAYNVVEMVFIEGKHDLLERDSLIYLAYVLARRRSSVSASAILRKMVELEGFVMPVSAWSGVISHMSQTAVGAYLAVDLILEIGYVFKDNRVDPRKKSNRELLAMKPNATAFGIALCGSVLFGTTKKAEQLLDLMPRVGVKPDLTLLIIMAHIYDKNGYIEEIKKLKRFIYEASNLSDTQLEQFYNCLLSCHVNLGDLDSASEIVLELLQKSKQARRLLSDATLITDVGGITNITVDYFDPKNSKSEVNSNKVIGDVAPSFVEFAGDRNFLNLESEAKTLLDLMLAQLRGRVELVKSEDGILYPTKKMYAKLIRAFLEAGKVSDLATFLIKVDREEGPVSMDNSAFVQSMNACINLGWLERAYDLLDEMRFSGVRANGAVYSSLIKAFCKENRPKEVSSLLKDARKDGAQLDSSCYEVLLQSRVLQKDTSGALCIFKEMKEAKLPKSGNEQFDILVRECANSGEAGLMAKLLEEIKEEQRVDCGVNDWNNAIHFFCKRRLMQDAEKALKKMRSLGHQPNAQTFHSMVTGYAALGGKYVEVTELWGEMKVLAVSSSMKFDQELLDSLLYTFVRGGFFLRANEVVEMMEKERMFIDKYKYRTLFLKYHKTLYKGKAPKFQTEAQCKRREAALIFKKWVGLN